MKKKLQNIYQRMNKVMEAVKYVQKEDKKNGMPYRFVSHDAVAAALHEEITKQGIYPSSTMDYNKDTGLLTVTVNFINIDAPEDVYKSTCILPISRQTDVKDFGSVYSYGYKYIMLKSFMLESGEEDSEVRDSKEEKIQYISKEQVEEIKRVLGTKIEYMQKLLKYFNVQHVEEIPAKAYGIVQRFLEGAAKKGVNNE